MKSNTPSKDFIDQICSLYGEIYDDREEDSRPPAAGDSSRISGKDWAPGQKSNHKSLLAFQNQLKKEGISLSTSKIRKILITGGCWSTERSRQIGELFNYYTASIDDNGKGLPSDEAIRRIAEELVVSVVTVDVNLPYLNVVYNLDDKSSNAVRCERYRNKSNSIDRLKYIDINNENKETIIDESYSKIIKYGEKIDNYTIAGNFEGLKAIIDELKSMDKADDNNAILNYFLGTSYGTYANYKISVGTKYMDREIIELRRLSMMYYRRAVSGFFQGDYPQILFLRILTNYANSLHLTGRVIEALSVYRDILDIDNTFSMAKVNYGVALRYLARMVNDVGHYNDLHCYAYQAIKDAVDNRDYDMYEEAVEGFKRIVSDYEDLPSAEYYKEKIEYKEYSLGNSDDEIGYRKWCLDNHLFLNPLNEVVEIETAFAHDPLVLTSLSEDISFSDNINHNPVEPPRWFAMINQLKEEFAYSRYLCYLGFETDGVVHYADNDVKLTKDDYDNCLYSIRIENIKNSFRISYSMLDQICFFVNDYWKLGLGEREADTKHLIRLKNYPFNNAALVSLYWLLCEIYEDYENTMKPNERNLYVLRNAMEHKFVKIHDNSWDGALKIERDKFYHVSEDILKEYTMRLLRLAREAMFYLVYAVGIEENNKDIGSGAVRFDLMDYPDWWKR